jgi:acyl carrier protein
VLARTSRRHGNTTGGHPASLVFLCKESDMTRLHEVVAEVLRQPIGTISDETSQKTAGSWDSLRHIELVMAVEDAFEVAFPPAEVSTMTSVAAIRQLLLRKGAAA